MENTVLMVLAIIGVALAACYVPLVGLVAMAWASYKWVGIYGAVVVTLFWIRYGAPVLAWPPRVAP